MRKRYFIIHTGKKYFIINVFSYPDKIILFCLDVSPLRFCKNDSISLTIV